METQRDKIESDYMNETEGKGDLTSKDFEEYYDKCVITKAKYLNEELDLEGYFECQSGFSPNCDRYLPNREASDPICDYCANDIGIEMRRGVEE